VNILPDATVRRTLRLMGRSPDDKVAKDVALDMCQRLGLKALVAGSISPIGKHYAVALEAVDSRSGDVLAETMVEAGAKEEVLKALSQAASRLRRALGESLPSIRKFDALLERTSSSLEALQAYSLGFQERRNGKYLQSIPFLRRAVELDSNFAYAYAELATVYRNTKQPGLAEEFTAKAYNLRERVSERESLYIASLYHYFVMGDADKTITALQLYEQIFPRDVMPHNNLSQVYTAIGQFDRAVDEAREAMKLDPNSANRYGSLGNALIRSDRFEDAANVYRQALAQKLEDTAIHHGMYWLAFVKREEPAMKTQLEWMRKQPDAFVAAHWQAEGTAYYGQWRASMALEREAIDGAVAAGARDAAAGYAAEEARLSAVVGRCVEARKLANEALALVRTPVSVPRAALALAVCGETGEVHQLAEELRTRYPQNTLVNREWLPTIEAALDINHGNGAGAVEALKVAIPNQGDMEFWPQYNRAQGYLKERKAAEAVAEFKGMLDHRGKMPDSPLYSLAYLGLARSAALQGDTAQARKSYEDFLGVWKDADKDLPALVAAKQELAGLK
jgi:eukaryotic-like serine/threonine-protein kinase